MTRRDLDRLEAVVGVALLAALLVFGLVAFA